MYGTKLSYASIRSRTESPRLDSTQNSNLYLNHMHDLHMKTTYSGQNETPDFKIPLNFPLNMLHFTKHEGFIWSKQINYRYFSSALFIEFRTVR